MRRAITTDCHVAPPPTLSEELPERMRSSVPHLEERADGVFLVRPQPLTEEMKAVLGDEIVDAMTAMLAAGVKVDPDDEEEMARLSIGNCCEDARPGFSAQSFLGELDRDGLAGAVLIGPTAFGPNADAELDIAWCGLLNDWAAETFSDQLDRLAPGISLPLIDVVASVRELERAAGLGLRPALLPDVVPSNPYTDPSWEPLWEAAEGLGIPLAFHVGAPRAIYPWSSKTHYSPGLGATSAFLITSMGMAETVSWFACSGILERHPELKVVMVEGSAGWLAFAMNFLDHHYHGRFGDEFLTKQGFASSRVTAEPPSHYIRRQVSCTFMDDPAAIACRELTGLDSLMWGNDYPHHEGIFPDSQQWINKQFSGLPEEEIDQIIFGNAARLFGIAGPSPAST